MALCPPYAIALVRVDPSVWDWFVGVLFGLRAIGRISLFNHMLVFNNIVCGGRDL